MKLFRAVSLASLCLFLSVTLDVAGQDKDKAKKFEIPKDAVAGKIKAVDTKAASFTLSIEKAKDRVFLVDKATEFWGPKGGDRGTGPEGLKDDCMAVGYEIKVAPTKDGKTAKDVFLPVRKAAEKGKDDKGKDKGK